MMTVSNGNMNMQIGPRNAPNVTDNTAANKYVLIQIRLIDDIDSFNVYFLIHLIMSNDELIISVVRVHLQQNEHVVGSRKCQWRLGRLFC